MAPSPGQHDRKKRTNARLGVQDLVLTFYLGGSEAVSEWNVPGCGDEKVREGLKWGRIGDEIRRASERRGKGLALTSREHKGVVDASTGHREKVEGPRVLKRTKSGSLRDRGAIKIAAGGEAQKVEQASLK